MFGSSNLLSQRCHILCELEILWRDGIFKRFPWSKRPQILCTFAVLEIFLKIQYLWQFFMIVKMSMKILYLHWVEVPLQLCKFPGVWRAGNAGEQGRQAASWGWMGDVTSCVAQCLPTGPQPHIWAKGRVWAEGTGNGWKGKREGSKWCEGEQVGGWVQGHAEWMVEQRMQVHSALTAEPMHLVNHLWEFPKIWSQALKYEKMRN